ncbi:MAG: response regulator [Candidatus Pacebacteria bacterium]|nr:response regulator [Candidatus Paceibacterota bacterium]
MENNKVLSIEDDKFLSSLVAKKLSAAGFEMIHATNGEDALDMVKDEKPAIILLDILLPEMSGFEVLEKLKADEETKSIPVLLFSNLGQREDIDKGIKLGAEKFIVKATVVLDDIVKEIQDTLAKK